MLRNPGRNRRQSCYVIPAILLTMQIPEYMLCGRAGCRETCLSGSERAGRKRATARMYAPPFHSMRSHICDRGVMFLPYSRYLGTAAWTWFVTMLGLHRLMLSRHTEKPALSDNWRL